MKAPGNGIAADAVAIHFEAGPSKELRRRTMKKGLLLTMALVLALNLCVLPMAQAETKSEAKRS